ncbi:Glycerol-3-phosphate ABC transporter, permease protein UgpE (TC 3.A.1.1.3) [hydrothermal vent metagenome]|uniref:Glycerol-3-phosphate ABC transporter, permease protein UgpE (TC 3.A.1.1.3) n=1 Tax=hydrothermal vent metagenome TaxID=652676 RepID=A0A3B0TD46_9ZZZZ
MTRAAITTHLILIAGAVFLLTPVALIILSSTHSTATLVGEGPQLSWGGRAVENYARVFNFEAGFTKGVSLAAMLKNSAIVALGSAVLTTVFSLLTAYAIVFFRLRAANFIFWLVFLTLLFPIESRIIPTYGITTELGLINTHLGIILPTLSLALGTFFFRQYFLTIPKEFLEAATLDGAGPVRFLIDFIVPLSFARAGAIFTIAFMIGWNQYLWPLMISTDDSLYTLVRGIRLMGQASGPGMALLTITILPPLAMLIVFQRWFFSGLVEKQGLDE